MESEQAKDPVPASSELENTATQASAPPQPETPEQAAQRAERAEARLAHQRRRRARAEAIEALGPPELSVPERRKAVGSVEAPSVHGANMAPIQMPGAGVSTPVSISAANPKPAVVRPPASRATLKRRHRITILTFVLFVILPLGLLAGYLWTFAQDQYASEAGFSVRKEEGQGSLDMLGGLTQLTGSASTDAEILYDFISSPDMVAMMDKELDLFKIFGRHYDTDPLFSLAPDSTIEDKEYYWQRMVKVDYNESTGILGLEVRAFTPEEAQKIGNAIIEYSSKMINQLSNTAREDATRYARTELDKAVASLKDARAAITEYRTKYNEVDPTQSTSSSASQISKLEAELVDALIQLDTLKATVRGSNPQIEQTELRISLIQKRLTAERNKIGIGEPGSAENESYAQKLAEYERLEVDREVAEERFRQTTLLYSAAEADANRKSRYLAAHVSPTLAQSAVYPNYGMILLTIGFFLFLTWALIVLIFYSIRDRR